MDLDALQVQNGLFMQARPSDEGGGVWPLPRRRGQVAWAREIESEMDRGTFVSRAEAERMTVAELLDRYRLEITPSKASADREVLRLQLLKRPLGCHCLANLTSRQIASYRDSRLPERRAGATVVKELNTLSHAIDTAGREWDIFLPQNPVKLVKRPKVAAGRERRLQPGEFKKLLDPRWRITRMMLIPSVSSLVSCSRAVDKARTPR
jgi:hypothetical protein